ncbi:DUF4439 domain-containing protein [Cellulomonas sp. 179-A 9B4 NHS]|uniref:DUF4439 domain-containing protein n=1 Tax=Cellulomonas sp. 179-A 9B4 NHS TaxID=3142379 RepID=UPI0039A2AB0D
MDRPAAPAPSGTPSGTAPSGTAPPRKSPAARRTTVRRTARAVLALACALPLAACGLRLETPPPVEPSPDALEQVRGRTVADALGLAADADAVAAGTPDGPARTVLLDVAAFSRQHADAAGGVYDSGLPDPEPSASTAPPPAPAADAAALVAELADDAATAAADADEVVDGPLARLVASVATSRAELADRLADATGLPRPEPAGSADDPAGTPDAGTPDAGASDAGTTGSDAPVPGTTGTASPTADADAGSTAALGADAAALAAVALAHDEAGFAHEVVAARRSDDARAQSRAEAARHRAAGNRWAVAAGVAGRPADPRRSAYALPADLDDPAVVDDLLRRLESGVADAYAAATASAAPGERGPLLAGLREAHAAAGARGAAPVPFPGVPELATAPLG